jgi:hypothetical protein
MATDRAPTAALKHHSMIRHGLLLLFLLLGLLPARHANAWSEDPASPEGWAWSEIKADRVADFNDKCGKVLDPNDAAGWDNPCRQVSPQFLLDVLTVAKWRAQIGQHGVRLRGAHIAADVDLEDTEIPGEVDLEAGRFDGTVDFNDAHLKQIASLDGSALLGAFSASRVQVDSSFTFHATSFAGGADLSAAKITGDLGLGGARFDKALNAESLEVHGHLLMNDRAKFSDEVNLPNARIGGALHLETSSFAGPLNADSLAVQGHLFMNDRASFLSNVFLASAKIGGNVLMSASSFAGALNADSIVVQGHLLMNDNALFLGSAILDSARISGDVDMSTAAFAKELSGDSIDVRGHLLMNDHARFFDNVHLSGAMVGGNLRMNAASFTKGLDANSLTVHDHLFMNDDASFGGPVYLGVSKVEGSVFMDSAAFADTLDADSIDVHGHLAMNDASFAKDVNFANAKIGSNLYMDGARFRGELVLALVHVGGMLSMNSAVIANRLNAASVDVGGDLQMRDHAALNGEVWLFAARIGGDVVMDTAVFSQAVYAERMNVRGSAFLRTSTFAGDVSLSAARLGRLELVSAELRSLDLSEAVVDGDLQVEYVGWRCSAAQVRPSHWPLSGPSRQNDACAAIDARPPLLNLRNAHIETFQDTYDAWPPEMDLEGFRYDRIGGVGSADMGQRPIDEWVAWLKRKTIFSPQPYTQLASILSAAGRRDAAEAILLAGRERERDEIWSQPSQGFWPWLWHGFPHWLWLVFFSSIAGYGIGLSTFRVVYWVAALTVAGAIVLWWSPYAQARGIFWRLGASLHRLLPVVELHKEFKDFFDNAPSPPGLPATKLYRWQTIFFCAVALLGWALGLVLLAAIANLTPR